MFKNKCAVCEPLVYKVFPTIELRHTHCSLKYNYLHYSNEVPIETKVQQLFEDSFSYNY